MNETIWCYIGPTIRGVIQRNTLYTGTREEVECSIQRHIDRYPRIRNLIVGGSDLTADRQKVNTPGNRLYEEYRKLVAEIN